MMRRTAILALVFGFVLSGCATGNGPRAAAEPEDTSAAVLRDRYLDALDQRIEGDSRAFYDELIALAHDDPDGRIGRRARVALSGGTGASFAVTVGALAAMAIPNFQKFSARAQQAEAKSLLAGAFVAQQAYRAEFGRFCPTIAKCGLSVDPRGRYVLFFGAREFAGGLALPDRRSVLEQTAIFFDESKVRPMVKKDRFVLVAVSNLDADPDLDVWTIDQDNELVHVQNDLD